MADEETLVLSGSISAGNKILATLGDIKFYGLSRSNNSRLRAPVYSGDDTIIVEDGLDWTVGDQIYIAPTAMQHDHSEYRTIVEYSSGLITLDEPLERYHWGQGSSTGSSHSGVDMRAEVILLTRNILIKGEDVDGWGG